MQSNLVPERRTDRNGKVVLRHVRSEFVKSKPEAGNSIPKPVVDSNILQSVRLKELDSGGLTLALLSDVRELEKDGVMDYDAVFNALHVATFLHRHQTRANRKNLPRTPYIEHPLRNTLRTLRWGCEDQDVIVATILHDTVEDCADDIVSHYLGHEDPDSLDESTKRSMALGWVGQEFGPEVQRIVHAVSNPIREGKENISREEKRIAYAKHVESVIKDDPKVFLVKFADFVDNAIGLPHNNVDGNHGMVSRLAAKYLPVASIFEREFESNEDIGMYANADGYSEIQEQIQDAKLKLNKLVS